MPSTITKKNHNGKASSSEKKRTRKLSSFRKIDHQNFPESEDGLASPEKLFAKEQHGSETGSSSDGECNADENNTCDKNQTKSEGKEKPSSKLIYSVCNHSAVKSLLPTISSSLKHEKDLRISPSSVASPIHSMLGLVPNTHPSNISARSETSTLPESGLASFKDDPTKKIDLKSAPKNKALRKGKWTTEEEEYTEKIIHHFSSGLLALPEGMTLRSYLAEKLNCDPMRITKKFAGSSCLGKRAQRSSDQPRATVTDAKMALKELSYLEARFRLRVETGFSGIHFDSWGNNSVQNAAVLGAQMQASLLNNSSTMLGNGVISPALLASSSATYPIFNQVGAVIPSAEQLAQIQAGIHLPLQQHLTVPWLTANVNASTEQSGNLFPIFNRNNGSNASNLFGSGTSQITLDQFKNAQASLAWAQNHIQSAALQQSLSQWNLANIQSQILFPQIQGLASVSINTPRSALSTPSCNVSGSELSPKSEQHVNIESHNIKPTTDPSKEEGTETQENGKNLIVKHDKKNVPVNKEPIPPRPPSLANSSERTKEENDSASMLLGFINSLRKNHEAALIKARNEDQTEKTIEFTSQETISGKKSKDVSSSSLNSSSSNDAEQQSSNQETIGSLSALTSNPSDFSSNSSRGSSNDGDSSRNRKHDIKSYNDSSETPISGPKETVTTSETATSKKTHQINGENNEHETSSNSNYSSRNGSNTSDSSGGYYDETDRPSTLDSSEGTKTDQSSTSTSSEEDSDKDSSERKDVRPTKRRKTASFSCPSWPIYRNFK